MRDILSGRRRGAGAGLLRLGLLALAGPYGGLMRLRRWMYRSGLKKSRRIALPVISVGNLTTGGTGKTPMVAWVVGRLREAGRAAAVLTRGYKASAGRSDEAELLRRLCGVPVVVNADRVAGAAEAATLGADVLVLDDGFQHRRIRRDLDLVLIDAMNPFGYEHCLPRGLLREIPSALREADVIVITRSDAVSDGELDALRRRLLAAAPQASLCAAVHRPTHLVGPEGRRRPLDALAGRRAFAFCGLGNPEAFFRLIGKLGVLAVAHRALDDHVGYDRAAASGVCAEAQAADAELLLTTEKDAVKIDPAGFCLPLWQLAVEMDVVDGAESLTQRLQNAAGCRMDCAGPSP